MLEKAKERFEASEKLRRFLPMLKELAFTPARLEWLATADEWRVFAFCASVDD